MAELDALGLLVTADRPHPTQPEYADIARLTYLKCVIKVRWSFLLRHLPYLPI